MLQIQDKSTDTSWTISRRYNEFFDLNNYVKLNYEKKKKIIKNK